MSNALIFIFKEKIEALREFLLPFKYSNLNLRVITIFRISLFFKITKNKNHFAGVMDVTPLLLLFFKIIKRTEGTGGMPSFWQGVTGAPEGKETIIQAAKRELLEETGYIPSVLIETDLSFKIPMRDEWEEYYPEGTKEIPEYLFIGKINQLDLPKINPNEHTEWKWCSFEEAMDLLYWDNNKVALEYVKRFLEED